MANNTILPGVGDVIADEDIAGVKFQQFKLVDATIGSTNRAVVDSSGRLATLNTPVQASAATLANVAGSVTSTTLIAANTSRKGFVLVNDSAAVLYVKFGSGAAATSLTYLLQAGATLESSPGVTYSGIITGVWASATGAARCTELT